MSISVFHEEEKAFLSLWIRWNLRMLASNIVCGFINKAVLIISHETEEQSIIAAPDVGIAMWTQEFLN